MSQETNLAEIWKSQYRQKALTISQKVNAQALTLGPKGLSQEPNLAESENLDYQHKVLTISKKRMRLGADSGAERREPGTKSRRNLRRNLEILITSIRH